MSGDRPPYIKWNKSTDESNPDKREIKVVGTETFETEYSICVKVQEKRSGRWADAILPLKSHGSPNASLLNWWIDGVKNGTIRKGKVFTIMSWVGTSKNDHPIRRYKVRA